MKKKKPDNPFTLGGYYGKKYFCDRDAELELLTENFENGRNTVLYAWRRLGKTALIEYFLEHLEAEGKADTLYIDLLATRDFDEAMKQLVMAVYARYGRVSGGISSAFQKLAGMIGLEMSFDPHTGLPSFSFGLRQAAKPETSLQAIGEFLQSQKKKVLIAFDEFQQVAEYSDQNGEALFRAWMQSVPDIRFIFSGSHRGMMTAMFTEKKRPFYRSAQLLSLGPIELPIYQKFIKKHFADAAKTIHNEEIEALYHWSRGQTYCIQLICNKLYAKCSEVKPDHREAVYREILAQEAPIFAQYMQLLTQTQFKVLRALAKNEPARTPLSKDFLMAHRLGAASSVSTALNMLMKNEIAVKEDDTYLVQDVILARWLQSL